jgi:hypothetical protein
MHLLPLAGWNHILECCKFLIHLRPPPSFDQAVSSFPSNLSTGCAGSTRLLLLRASLCSAIGGRLCVPLYGGLG